MAEEDVDLADVDGFAKAIKEMGWLVPGLPNRKQNFINAVGMHCVRCGGVRRMAIRRVLWSGTGDKERALFNSENGTPGFFSMTCVQCHLHHDVLVHMGPEGPEIAIFSAERGGFSTPNTPGNVKYYLDQAHRSGTVGAASAAISMYRSAVEMLLYEQGYKTGMLDRKIKDLEADSSPPVWRDQIDPDYLEVMRKLGNGAIHPNDGDVQKQIALDRALLLQVRAALEELLDTIYERPAKIAARKTVLAAAAESLKP